MRGAAAGQREISRLAKRPWPEFIEEDSMKTQATMKTAPAAKKTRVHHDRRLSWGRERPRLCGELAAWLRGRGLRAGLITNDQGRNLVDTALSPRSRGFATEEIPGGCFCCRFDSLVDAAMKLRSGNPRPILYIAEPVGSCTDLVATVAYPLRKLHRSQFNVAPVSVLVDPVRGERAFAPGAGGGFSEKVNYIYFKQLEEADLIVIAKSDLLDAARLENLRRAISARFPKPGNPGRLRADGDESGGLVRADHPRKPVGDNGDAGGLRGLCRGRGPVGLAELHRQHQGENPLRRQPVSGPARPRDPATAAGGESRDRPPQDDAQKRRRQPRGGGGESDAQRRRAGISLPLPQEVTCAQLTINLRAEAAPHILGGAVSGGLAAAAAAFPKLTVTPDHLEHFRPGKPTPTHRVTRLAA